MYILRDKPYGLIISTYETIEEAQSDIKIYERMDRANGMYEEDFYEVVLGNLKLIREANELTQLRLSELSGVKFRLIQDYEQGVKNIKKAPREIVEALSHVLNCKPEDILV